MSVKSIQEVVEVIDNFSYLAKQQGGSRPTVQAITHTLAQRKQTILLILLTGV